MPDEVPGDQPDTEPAFDSRIFQAGVFQTERRRFFGAMSIAFAGIVYTALITVVGVVIALIPSHGFARVGWVIGYVVFSAALFWWGVTKGRNQVIAFARKVMGLPSNQG